MPERVTLRLLVNRRMFARTTRTVRVLSSVRRVVRVPHSGQHTFRALQWVAPVRGSPSSRQSVSPMAIAGQLLRKGDPELPFRSVHTPVIRHCSAGLATDVRVLLGVYFHPPPGGQAEVLPHQIPGGVHVAIRPDALHAT
jgi:hypothetical protein